MEVLNPINHLCGNINCSWHFMCVKIAWIFSHCKIWLLHATFIMMREWEHGVISPQYMLETYRRKAMLNNPIVIDLSCAKWQLLRSAHWHIYCVCCWDCHITSYTHCWLSPLILRHVTEGPCSWSFWFPPHTHTPVMITMSVLLLNNLMTVDSENSVFVPKLNLVCFNK